METAAAASGDPAGDAAVEASGWEYLGAMAGNGAPAEETGASSGAGGGGGYAGGGLDASADAARGRKQLREDGGTEVEADRGRTTGGRRQRRRRRPARARSGAARRRLVRGIACYSPHLARRGRSERSLGLGHWGVRSSRGAVGITRSRARFYLALLPPLARLLGQPLRHSSAPLSYRSLSVLHFSSPTRPPRREVDS